VKSILDMFCFYFFFFSSRRRHTRWPRDWSSDVCSSDLFFFGVASADTEEEPILEQQRRGGAGLREDRRVDADDRAGDADADVQRSEERRVGKECRCGWGMGEWKREVGVWRGGGRSGRTE